MRNASSNIPFRQYRRALRYVLPHWRGLVLVLVLGLFSTAVALTQPYISGMLIDRALLRHNMRALEEIAALLVLVSVVSFGLNVWSSYAYIRLSAESLFHMRLDVYRHLQKLSPRYFAQKKLGDIVSRINNDIGEVQRICADTMLSVVSNLFFLVGSMTVMLWLNWRMYLLSITVLPLGMLALRHYQSRLASRAKTLRERSSSLGSFLIESLLGMRLVVACRSEEREAEKFRQHNSRFLSALLSMQTASFLAAGIPATLLTLSIAALFLYGGSLVIHGALSIGKLVAFMAYHARLLSPAQNLLGIYTNLLTGGVALGRVFEIVDVPVEVREKPGAAAISSLRGGIVFNHVRFRYVDDVPVIDDASFHIPAGSLCAVVGPSGAGKSTIADLLMRLYDPQCGTISIDGHDLRDMRFEDLRREIAVVEQTPYLFAATVQENIAYGRQGATFDEIRSCATSAAIDDFIQSLPQGYSTLVGERGATLSAGERQRIALARALLRNPSILVMDEPTAALDPTSESAIAEAFSRVLRGRTAILITHRMSLVEIADYVIVLDSGGVLESGSPRALLSGNGFLSKQFQLARIPASVAP